MRLAFDTTSDSVPDSIHSVETLNETASSNSASNSTKRISSIHALPPVSPRSPPIVIVDNMETENNEYESEGEDIHDEDYYSPDCACVNCQTKLADDLFAIKQTRN